MSMLNHIANEILENHDDMNCCSKQKFRHFGFQCMFHEENVIASYHRGDYAHLGMEQVEQFIIFMGAYELKTFKDLNYEISAVARKHECVLDCTLDICINDFSENIYVVDFNEGSTTARESTNVLQEEDDKSLSLGMTMPPKEEYKEEQVEEEWSSYPSSTPNNGNIQIPMNNPSYTISSDDDSSLPSSPLCGTIVSNIWEDESDIIE